MPQAREGSIDNIIRVSSATLPKFNGDRCAYITWRNSFIPGVHLAPIDVSYKIMLLRSSMETPTRRMKEFEDSLVGCTSLAWHWTNLQQWTKAYLEQLSKELRPHLQLATRSRAAGRVNTDPASDLREGDVVTFLLPSAAKMWPLARINRVFPGPD